MKIGHNTRLVVEIRHEVDSRHYGALKVARLAVEGDGEDAMERLVDGEDNNGEASGGGTCGLGKKRVGMVRMTRTVMESLVMEVRWRQQGW